MSHLFVTAAEDARPGRTVVAALAEGVRGGRSVVACSHEQLPQHDHTADQGRDVLTYGLHCCRGYQGLPQQEHTADQGRDVLT